MRNEQTLRNLLRVLIQEWGSEEVQRSFTYLSEHPNLFRATQRSTNGERKLKPSPSQLVEQSTLDPHKKVLLMQIAKKYETREFLPSTSDVREFMFLLGDQPNGLKDRKDAFRTLLQSLSKLPVDRLKDIELNAEHAGPSQLGPLSNAIADAGANHSRAKEARNTSQSADKFANEKSSTKWANDQMINSHS
jgi:hypothetical protein